MSREYINDDYAGLDFDGGSFYFGYEQTLCSKCKSRDCNNESHDEYQEWCFVASIEGSPDFVVPQSELEVEHHGNTENYLLSGIGQWLESQKAED